MRRPLEVMSKKDIIETILFLLEQIYRAYKINNHESYHK